MAVESKARITGGAEEIEAVTIDVSLDGALLRAERVFPQGMAVRISLFLGETDTVVGHGAVKRTVNNNRMGIQFDGLSTSESTRLQDFLLPLVTA